jgi:hypothetical protein
MSQKATTVADVRERGELETPPSFPELDLWLKEDLSPTLASRKNRVDPQVVPSP